MLQSYTLTPQSSWSFTPTIKSSHSYVVATLLSSTPCCWSIVTFLIGCLILAVIVSVACGGISVGSCFISGVSGAVIVKRRFIAKAVAFRSRVSGWGLSASLMFLLKGGAAFLTLIVGSMLTIRFDLLMSRFTFAVTRLFSIFLLLMIC